MSENAERPGEILELSGDLRVAVGRIARRMKQLYETGEVTFSEISVLSRLDREGPSAPTTLAAAEHVRPQAMVAIVNALEQRKLVKRRADPTDGRKTVVSMTESGRQELRDKGWTITQRMAEVLAESLTPNEQHRLRDTLPLLERLARLL